MFSKQSGWLLSAIVILFANSCIVINKSIQPTANPGSIKLIGQYEIPYNLAYKNTTIGGFSGIDYDKKSNQYYIISDDRSDKNPARYYTVRIYLHEKGIDSIIFIGVSNLLQPDGSMYPNNKQNRFLTPDPETIRYNPVKGRLIWASEGERIVNEKDTILVNPSITSIHPKGKYINNFILPGNLFMHADEKGPRRNGVLEGMSFADNYKTLYVSLEEPLYEDGPQAALADTNAFIRIYRFDVTSRKNTAQYAYKLSPIAYPAVPETAFKINGVPEILSLGNNKLLVIERSFSTGRLACSIKMFIAELAVATDISKITLKDNDRFVPAFKRLLLNMDDLGIYTDNIEGVTFGPLLPNGHRTLLFIADNNFNPLEKTQLLLFELIE